MRFSTIAVIALLLILNGSVIAGGTAPAPTKTITGNFGAGLSMTGGNTDTKSFNLSFEATRDPKTRSVIKTNGLYLKSSSNNQTTADLLRLNFRDDYLLNKRVGLYGAMGYLRDPFKEIAYLLNPQAGLDFKLYSSDQTKLSLSGGAGGVWEKDTGFDVQPSGTLNAGQSFSFKFSDAAKVTQNLTGLWKTEELSDAFYHFDIALVTSIVKKVDVKFEFMDDYKNKTVLPTIKKNDTTLIISFLYKF
jgi:putative salt-induced outer membrane protein YdiY